LEWCDAVNMLRIQMERQTDANFPSLRDYMLKFQLNSERLSQLKKELVILHPGPINRGVEITSQVADSDQSVILEQVENGVAVRMAVIFLLSQGMNRS
jgi:aspartate carbamoyltransferase catalytic subunit